MTSPSRYAQRKDANQGEIVKVLRELGFRVITMHTPTDLLAARDDFNHLIEIKDGTKKKYTPAQVKFNADWPGRKVTLRSVEDAIQWASIV